GRITSGRLTTRFPPAKNDIGLVSAPHGVRRGIRAAVAISQSRQPAPIVVSSLSVTRSRRSAPAIPIATPGGEYEAPPVRDEIESSPCPTPSIPVGDVASSS